MVSEDRDESISLSPKVKFLLQILKDNYFLKLTESRHMKNFFWAAFFSEDEDGDVVSKVTV